MTKTIRILGITTLLVITLVIGVLAGAVIGGVASAQGPVGGPFGFGGMMGSGWGMMRGWGQRIAPGGGRISLGRAVESAQSYVASYNNPDLALDEVMEFDRNFYVIVKEKGTGTAAFEILVDPYSGYVHPEPGPNMMWNTKYSPMGSMMGGFRGMMGGWQRGNFASVQGTQMPVTISQAREAAQSYLNGALPGATLSESTDTFYGYYTIDVERDGKAYGMLSVNGYGGQVWYHSWHGTFIQEKELG